MGLLSIFSFGGAYSILPQMHHDVVEQHHWLTSEQFARFWALGQLVPGPTLTVGSIIGFAIAGVTGALVATLALFLPAAGIVYALGSVWSRLGGNPWRDRVAAGLAPVVLGLMFAGSVALMHGAVNGTVTALIATAVGALMLATKVNRTLLVLVAGAAGYLWLR
jgi:chromate transporter